MDADPKATEPIVSDEEDPVGVGPGVREKARSSLQRQRVRFNQLAAAAADVVRESPCTCSPSGLCAVHRLERVLIGLTSQRRRRNRRQ